MSTRTTVRSTIAGSNGTLQRRSGTRRRRAPEGRSLASAARGPSVARLGTPRVPSVSMTHQPSRRLDAGSVALRGTLTHGRRLVQ